MALLRKISSEPATDADLIARYKSGGSLETLGDLYNRYMDLVYGICLKYLKNPDDAQDAVMAIFEELISKLQKHNVENFKSWLHTLAKNHCLMRLRSQKNGFGVKIEDELMQSQADVHLEDALQREENLNQLERCLSGLPAQQRTTVELFYLQGKCYNEIVTQTGLEWSAVRSHIQNGRRNLKICMDAAAKQMVQ